MITINRVRVREGEPSKLRIVSTNSIKDPMKDEIVGEPRPPRKVNGRILQAGAVPPDDPGPREIRVLARPGKAPVVVSSEPAAAEEPKARKKPGPKPGTRKAKA